MDITGEQYEALLVWARAGAEAADQEAAFLALRKAIDLEHLISRYTLVIRYEQLPEQPRPGESVAPKGGTKLIELTRKPTRDDVEDALRGETTYSGLIYVTADPNGEVGWYELEQYPW